MSSTSPPSDTSLSAPSSSSLPVPVDSADVAPVLPPLNLSTFDTSDGLDLGVHDPPSLSPPPLNDDVVSSDTNLIDAGTNSHLLHLTSASAPIPIPIPVMMSSTHGGKLHATPARTFVMSSSRALGAPDMMGEQGSAPGAGIDIESLPPEVTKADLFIASDGSFVQTSSALAARELKKCYDKILRVGQRDQVVRSPYAITVVEDETGAKVFRISRRDEDAVPLASDHPIAQPQAQNQPAASTATTSSRRKARLSVQDFLPSGMFKPYNSINAAVGNSNLNQAEGGANTSSSSPTTNLSPSSPPPTTRRKLRKTRSNSDLHSRVTQSPSNSTETHSQVPSQRNVSRYTYGYDTYSIHPTLEIRDELTAGADAFSQVLGWASELATDTGAIASSSRRKGKSISGAGKGLSILIGNAEDGHIQANTHGEVDSTLASTSVAASTAPSRSRSPSAAGGLTSVNTNANAPRRPSVSTSAALSNVGVTNNGSMAGLNNAFNNHQVGEIWHSVSPFGENVKYTTPLRVSNGNSGSESPVGTETEAEDSSPLVEDPLSQPPQLRELREMQSFESGLTARVGDFGIGRERNAASFGSDSAFGVTPSEPGTPKLAKEETDDSLHTSLGNYSFPFNNISNTWLHFSTRVFDVIQTYKGLPLPSALLSAPPTGATIKITATESPKPKDDPRFVIWGEIYGDSGGTNTGTLDDASMSVSMSGGSQTESNTQSSHTHSTSSAASHPPRKRSNARPPDLPSTVNSEAAPRTAIIAATVERWIAQLTSELDYDELLNFLLTYRTYITSTDLCHLLICRFHWTLENSTSKQDEMVRRIIRLRTFIAIRYWLLTFFREDFLPNPILCTLFTTWLNSLFRDISNKGSGCGDALGIIRKLKKVVRECKAAHSRQGADSVTNSVDSIIDDSDVDLDFSNTHGSFSAHGSGSGTGAVSSSASIDLGLSFDAAAKFGINPASGSRNQPRPASLVALTGPHVPLTSPNTVLLSQPLSKTILDHVKSPKSGTDAPLAQAAGLGTLPLLSRSGTPYHSSALSRAFVNTIGRLGRWKRVLNVRDARSSAAIGGGSYASNMAVGYVPQFEVRNLSPEFASNRLSSSAVEPALHSTPSMTGNPNAGLGIGIANTAEELLHVKGGVEGYLKMLKLGPSNLDAGSNVPDMTASFSSKEGVLAPVGGGAEGLNDHSQSISNASLNERHEDDDEPCPVHPPGLDIPTPSIVLPPESFSSSDENGTHFVDSPSLIASSINTFLETDGQTAVESTADFVSSELGQGSGEDERGLQRTASSDEGSTQSVRNVQREKGWVPDVVSLDDYDLSTSESDLSSGDDQGDRDRDVGVGVGVRKGKTTRRLPLRREFQFVRGSGGSVSSLGIRSGSSFVLGTRSRSGSRERENARIDSVISSATAHIRSEGPRSPDRSTRRSSRSSVSSSSQRMTSQASIVQAGDRAPHFQQWQIELISDDEEEAGDAEAALRRLEGQIDVERQREKDLKVGRWLRTARARARDGIDFSAEGSGRTNDRESKYTESVGSIRSSGTSSSVMSDDDGDEKEGKGGEDLTANFNPATTGTPTLANPQYGNGSNAQERDRSGSVSSTTSVSISSSGGYANLASSANAAYPRTSTIEARRPSIISSNGVGSNANGNKLFKSSTVSNATAATLSVTTSSPASVPLSSHAPSAPLSGPSSTIPYAYRSFILLHRSEMLAQQFMIIEADLFKKIKFEEIIGHQWGQVIDDVNVRDWVSFVKERAKMKNARVTLGGAGTGSDSTSAGTFGNSTSMVQTTSHPKLSSILALRARFDLIVNFIASEVVLTHAVERVVLVEKIIRVAWKMYLHNNFNTLAAVVSGLQTRWVNKAMGKKWNKVGMWEQRIFEDLKRFVSREGEFKYIRNATAALIDQGPPSSGTEGGTISSPSVTGSSLNRDKEKEHSSPQGHSHHQRQQQPYCLPFLGAYLAQLYAYEKLPDFIDPTAPTEPVLIDITTGTLSPPSHPEVFFNLQPLPGDITLEPLINVHKQRLIAGVIKAFVGAQHLAASVPFKIDERCYQKCFRIRSLETDVLQSLLGREVGTG